MTRGRRACRSCAYHCYTNSEPRKRRQVIRHILTDDVEFFRSNFSRMELFHCSRFNLFIYLIAYSAFNVMDFIMKEYPHTNQNNGSSAYRGICSFLLRGGRYQKLSKKLSRSVINKLFVNGLLHPDYVFHDSRLFSRILIGHSLNLFTACVLHVYPRRKLIVQFDVFDTWGIYDAHYEHTHNAFHHDGNSLHIRINFSNKHDGFRYFKTMSFSYRILMFFYMILCGFDYRLEPARVHKEEVDDECIAIVNSFEEQRRNMPLSVLCRIRLLQSAPSYTRLSRFLSMFALPAGMKDSILMKDVDILTDASSLNMTTFVERYSEDPSLFFNDGYMNCLCCHDQSWHQPDYAFFWDREL